MEWLRANKTTFNQIQDNRWPPANVYLTSMAFRGDTVVLAGSYIAGLPSGNEFANVPNWLLWRGWMDDVVKQGGYAIQSITMAAQGPNAIRKYSI